MTDSQFIWTTVINGLVALGTAGAVVVALFGKKFFVPKLEIVLANPLGELTKWEKDGKQHAARFYHARVINTRRWSSGTNLSLNLIAVQEERPDHTFSDEWQGDVQIKWKHIRHYPQPNYIGKSVDYDLVSVDAETFVSLHPIAAASSFKRFRNEKCRLRVWLQARCTESDSHVTQFDISWDGMWAETAEEMKKHFIVETSLIV
jgi:hypothetical protein